MKEKLIKYYGIIMALLFLLVNTIFKSLIISGILYYIAICLLLIFNVIIRSTSAAMSRASWQATSRTRARRAARRARRRTRTARRPGLPASRSRGTASPPLARRRRGPGRAD